MANLIEEYQRLKALIEQYDESYYNQNISLVSDECYDILKNRFLWLSNILNIEYKKIGHKIKCPVIKHDIPMLSIESDVGIEIIKRFINKYPNQKIVAQHKIDGLSMVAKYAAGHLIYCATRGDGFEGEDVTSNGSKFLPQIIDYQNNISIFGEVYLSLKNFEKIKNNFSNPRNAASGILRRNSNAEHTNLLSFFAYDVTVGENYLDTLLFLKNLGFFIATSEKINSLEEAVKYYYKTEQQRSNIQYQIDGVVFKLNDKNVRANVGNNARFPRWAIASKFTPDVGITSIKKIDFQVSRNGILTPIGHIEPINIKGVCIKKIGLHNYAFIYEQHINTGAEIIVSRAGDVIPYVAAVVKPAVNNIDKVYCPSCNTLGSINKNYEKERKHLIHAFIAKYPKKIIDSQKFLYCNNTNCPVQKIGKIVHYLQTIKVQGVSYNFVKQLYENFDISLPNLYKLTKDSLIALNGWGTISASKFINQLKKPITLEQFIYALGFSGLGNTLAKKLAKQTKSWKNLQLLNSDAAIFSFLEGKLIDFLIVNDVNCIKDLLGEEYNLESNQKITNLLLPIMQYMPYYDFNHPKVNELAKHLQILDYNSLK